MSEIKINSPFQLKASVVESEDYLGSFRLEVIAIIPTASGQYTYSGTDIWIAYLDWDAFVSKYRAIDMPREGAAVFKSIDEKLEITLQAGAPCQIQLKIKTRSVDTQMYSALEYASPCSREEWAQWGRVIKEFPKWW